MSRVEIQKLKNVIGVHMQNLTKDGQLNLDHLVAAVLRKEKSLIKKVRQEADAHYVRALAHQVVGRKDRTDDENSQSELFANYGSLPKMIPVPIVVDGVRQKPVLKTVETATVQELRDYYLARIETDADSRKDRHSGIGNIVEALKDLDLDSDELVVDVLKRINRSSKKKKSTGGSK